MIPKRQQIIEILPYDPTWPAQFAAEADLITNIFKKEMVAIHHVGSTSIPNMPAKPTIDIILVVSDIEQVDQHNASMENLGYEAWGEYRIPGRRFFVKGEDKRTHHVHTFAQGSEHIDRHLYVRDYLIAHPQEAAQYAALKQKVAKQCRHNRRGYVEGKHDYIVALEQRAIAWWQAQHSSKIQ